MASKKGTFRKAITSPELIGQINPDNVMLMDMFLKDFAENHSLGSVINYRSNLQMFFCWNEVHNRNKRFKDIRKIEMMDFFDYAVKELKWNSNRYRQMHSCLSSFSAWVEDNFCGEKEYENFTNILLRIERPKRLPVLD